VETHVQFPLLPGEGEGEVMRRSSTTGSDSLFLQQTYTKRSKPAFNHLTLILSWKERKENRQPVRDRNAERKLLGNGRLTDE
jgi:hypothetical protein